MIAVTESRRNPHCLRCSALQQRLNPDAAVPPKIIVPRTESLKSRPPCLHIRIMHPLLASQQTPWTHLSSCASTLRPRYQMEQQQRHADPAMALFTRAEVINDPCGKQMMTTMHTAWEPIYFKVLHISRKQTTAATLNTHGPREAIFSIRAAPIVVSQHDASWETFAFLMCFISLSFATPWYCQFCYRPCSSIPIHGSTQEPFLSGSPRTF